MDQEKMNVPQASTDKNTTAMQDVKGVSEQLMVEGQSMPETSSIVAQPPKSEETIPSQQVNIKGKGKEKKTIKVVVFVVLGLVVLGVVAALIISTSKYFNKGAVVGEWDCYKYYWSSDTFDSEPSNTLILREDKTFMYGAYGDLENNHYAGTNYEYYSEDKFEDGYNFYVVEFGPTTEYILDGEVQSTVGRQMADLDMGIKYGLGSKEAFMIFEESYLAYKCIAR